MFWNKKEKTVLQKAEEANQVLNALGIEAHTESGKQIRNALAMELLGQKYDLMDKHSKATFVKQHGGVMKDVRQFLIEEGVLSNQGHKKLEETKK
jgi:hypothetical protein